MRFCLAIVGVVLASLPRPIAGAERPNVLILVADDHAAYTLGLDGDPHGATPSLDRLGRQGVYFERAFANAPVCTASRQSFLTGRYPHAVGVTVLKTSLPETAVTLGDWLSAHGYATAAVGKMHFNGPSSHGFDRLIDRPDWLRWLAQNPPEGGDRRRPWRPFRDPAEVWLNAEARDEGLPLASSEASYFVDRAAEYFQSHREGPFALVVSFHEPHSPFPFPREWSGKFRPEDFPVRPVSGFDRLQQPSIFAHLTPEHVRGIQAAYYTSLSYVDSQIGRVLDALDASSLAGRTLVIYWGDNGYALGHHGRFEKHTLYEESVRVPLIARWPGHLPEGRRVSELVELVDVFPTIDALLGLADPPDLHGRSLVGLLTGTSGACGRTEVFSEYLENEEAMIRTDQYKLIVGTGRRARKDGYETGRPLPGPYARLYDLSNDPGETADVAGEPESAAVVEDLRHRLYERYRATTAGFPSDLPEPEAIERCLIPRDAPD
jgi:choline-sulfatase